MTTKTTLPAGWRWMKLGDICNLVNGNAYKPSDWSTDGTRIIRIQNLNDATKPFNYWAGSLENRVLVKNGDVLLAWSGTPGTSFGTHRWLRGDAVLNQHIFRVDLNTDLVNPDWFVIATNFQLDVLISRAHGGVGLRHVKRGEVENLKIPLPPLTEQQRIAARLNEQLTAVAQARQAAEAQLRAARELPSAYLQQAFQGITPLSNGFDREKAPKGWNWRKLTSLARLESGHTPSRYHAEWWGGSIPWIALPDIRLLDGKVAHETSEYTNELGIANSSARILPKDTVAISRTASVGFVTIMGREMATSQDFFDWVCGPELNPRFLMKLFQASRDYFRSISSGAVHKTVYMPTAKALEVCIPSIDKQKEIAQFLDNKLSSVETMIASLEAQLAKINQLPSALLRRAFSGEL